MLLKASDQLAKQILVDNAGQPNVAKFILKYKNVQFVDEYAEDHEMSQDDNQIVPSELLQDCLTKSDGCKSVFYLLLKSQHQRKLSKPV